MYGCTGLQQKGVDMKFNHLTINSNHNVVQDTEEIFVSDESKAVCEGMFWAIVNGMKVEILDGVFAVGNIGESSYEIDLYDKKGAILMCTVGVIDEEKKKALECLLTIIYGAVYLFDVKIDEYDAPIVYDFIFPSITTRPYISKWTGDFCRTMGAIAFEYFKKKSKC